MSKRKFGGDDVTYWSSTAVAVWMVWLATGAHTDRSAMFYLFAAAFMLIHAHGRRIHSAIKNQSKEQS